MESEIERRERRRMTNQRYYAKHREDILEQQREYGKEYWKNKGEGAYNEYMREYYRKNKDRIIYKRKVREYGA